MDSVLGLPQGVGAPGAPVSFDGKHSIKSIDLTIIQDQITPGAKEDQVDIALGDPVKTLTITAQKILARLREIHPELPADEELKKSSPETAADTVVKGIGLLYERFKKANPELEAEELVTEFFKRARSGIEKGYGDAVNTLKGIDAYSIEGVEERVTKTKSLIDEKVDAFEAQIRRDLGLDTPDEVETETAKFVKNEIVKSASVNLIA